ncbi:hypothetical protein HK098_003531 [Nowakowskiella sp. JEL0407]|nr:hypothetical protein HK098_003531 [Nowakowskiella sp. JEL0407]
MDAAYITKLGRSPLSIGTIPIPKLDNYSVLIRVQCVSIQPVDIKTKTGEVRSLKGTPSVLDPLVLGYDCSGTVAEIGAKVTQWKVGDEVFVFSAAGGLARYTVVPESHIARKPSTVSFAHAAALVTSGSTSMQAFKYAREKCGPLKKVFITAGAGGVGHLAIQIAKQYFGVEFVATTASETKVDYVKSVGADVVVDYKKSGDESDFVKALSKYGPFDMALDCTVEAAKCKKIVKDGGMVVGLIGIPNGDAIARAVEMHKLKGIPTFVYSLLNFLTWFWNLGARVKVNYILALAEAKELEDLGELCADGKIKVFIQKVFPLSETNEAFEYLGKGHVKGRVIVDVSGENAGAASF